MAWRLTVKTVGGTTQYVELGQPQETTVLDLKKKILAKIPHATVYLQRLALQDKTVLDQDGQKLTSYTGLRDGAIIFLIIRTPFKLYIQDSLGKLHEITIPSQNPEAYTIAQLRALVEQTTAQRLDELQFQLKGKVVEECRHGRQLTLQDCGIKKEDTLFLMKVGIVLDITDPQVDVCFLVDCTSSMRSSIENVKSNIKQLRDNLETQYRGCDLLFSFVRYTDYDQPASSRTTYLNFTKSLPGFHNFVGGINAVGGGDTPEDIMGGLRVTFSQLSWRNKSSKVLIHIADAPCHGTQYHYMSTSDDSYSGGDPAGTTHEEMMREVVKLNIQYWFGYINKSLTDKMIGVFNDSLKRLSDHQLLIRQFEAVSSTQVGEAVHRSVTDSVLAAEVKKKRAVAHSVTTSPDIPNWSLIPEQSGVKTPAPGVKTVQSLQDGLTLEPPCIPIRIKRAPSMFTEGNECFIYHGLDATKNVRVVLKEFKTKFEDSSLDGYMKALEVQTIASAYAREFNCDKRKPSSVSSIDFPPVDIVDMQDSAHTCYILQKFIEGTFEKFNTNSGIVCSRSPVSDALQAFSHFTYVKSGQSLLICDLQGVQTPSGTTQLLDPAIHSKIGTNRYGPTDLGYRGIERFFRTHRCTNTCVQMGLETLGL